MDFLNQLSKEQRAIADKVVAAARKYGVPENIALGMAMQESGFDQSKASGTGPVGVLQVGRRASKDLKIDPKNVDENIDGGMRYFKQQLDRTGNIDAALVAYHDGPSSDFFKGGSMSPAAANHIQKVKGYAGMAKDTTTTAAAPATNFSVDVEDIAPAARFDETPTTEEKDGTRPRDINDVTAGIVGTAAGYGVGKTRQVSNEQQALELRRNALALREQNLEHGEARRQQNAQHQRELDAYNETIRRQNAQYQMDLEDHARYMAEAKANEAKLYGTGTENWKDQEYGEPIARQIEDPLSKSAASAEADAAIARHQKAKQLFPNQVPAGEGSLLSIPIVTGGQTQVPMQRNTRPAPAPAPQPPSKPIPPPMPSRPAPVAPPPLQVAPKPPGRLSTAGSSLLGGLAGTQLYNAYQDLKEGKVLDGLTSGTGGLSALMGTAVKSPRMKALSAVPASMSFIPELMDYFNSGEEVPAKAEGGMIESVPHYDVGGITIAKNVAKAAAPRAKEAWKYGSKQAGKLSDWAQNYINQYLVPTQADRMAGIGGPSFSANQLGRPEYAGIAWGSGKQGTATGIANLAKDPHFGGPQGQIFTPLLGEESQLQSNQIVYDKLMREFYKNHSQMTPELRAKINAFMQAGGPKSSGETRFSPIEKFDISDKDMMKELGNTFDMRKVISAHALGGEGLGGKKSQIIPHAEILQSMQDPLTSGAPTFALGPRAFRLSGQVEQTPRPDLNKAYPYMLHGEDMGVTFTPTPAELSLMDFQNQWRKQTGNTMPLKSGALKQPGYYENTTGYKPEGSSERVYPRQQITEEWIKELQRNAFAQGGLASL
jgi:hypothetical protein